MQFSYGFFFGFVVVENKSKIINFHINCVVHHTWTLDMDTTNARQKNNDKRNSILIKKLGKRVLISCWQSALSTWHTIHAIHGIDECKQSQSYSILYLGFGGWGNKLIYAASRPKHDSTKNVIRNKQNSRFSSSRSNEPVNGCELHFALIRKSIPFAMVHGSHRFANPIQCESVSYF